MYHCNNEIILTLLVFDFLEKVPPSFSCSHSKKVHIHSALNYIACFTQSFSFFLSIWQSHHNVTFFSTWLTWVNPKYPQLHSCWAISQSSMVCPLLHALLSIPDSLNIIIFNSSGFIVVNYHISHRKHTVKPSCARKALTSRDLCNSLVNSQLVLNEINLKQLHSVNM